MCLPYSVLLSATPSTPPRRMSTLPFLDRKLELEWCRLLTLDEAVNARVECNDTRNTDNLRRHRFGQRVYMVADGENDSSEHVMYIEVLEPAFATIKLEERSSSLLAHVTQLNRWICTSDSRATRSRRNSRHPDQQSQDGLQREGSGGAGRDRDTGWMPRCRCVSPPRRCRSSRSSDLPGARLTEQAFSRVRFHDNSHLASVRHSVSPRMLVKQPGMLRVVFARGVFIFYP